MSVPFQLLSPVLHDRERAQHQERAFVPESSWHVHQQRDRLRGENNYDYSFLTCDVQSTCCRKKARVKSLWKCFKGLTVLCSLAFGWYLSCRNDFNDYSGKCPSDFSKAKGDQVGILPVLSTHTPKPKDTAFIFHHNWKVLGIWLEKHVYFSVDWPIK